MSDWMFRKLYFKIYQDVSQPDIEVSKVSMFQNSTPLRTGPTIRIWKWRGTKCLNKKSPTMVGRQRKFCNLIALKQPQMSSKMVLNDTKNHFPIQN